MLVSLTVDGEFLYWISKAEDSTQIYQAKKSNGAILSQVEAPRSKHILVYSSVLQPFPGRKVTVFMSLFPRLGSGKSHLVSSSRAVLPAHHRALSIAPKGRVWGTLQLLFALGHSLSLCVLVAWAGAGHFRCGKSLSCQPLCSLSLLSHITSLRFVSCLP